jgi:acyl-CoA reductase-like NAD-dependent aldehyde dehydrogenase
VKSHVLNLPVYRWGVPYQSLESVEIPHFETGEPVARMGQANAGIVQRDLRRTQRAREVLKEAGPGHLLNCYRQAAELFLHGSPEVAGVPQSPEEFIRLQSASTGMPQNMCRANMQKIHFALSQMEQILSALTRGLDLEILQRGYGREQRGVIVSYQVQANVLGAVLPSNSPGVHTLWLPAIPLMVGLALKPGSAEPWTPYRVAAALWDSGVPREAIGLYPGGHDAGPAILSAAPRSMMFGSQETVDKYHGNPRVQVHGPGYAKIMLFDDMADRWEEFLDLMEESVLSNGGRSCVNCSSIWTTRHASRIAEALAARLGPVEVTSPQDPHAQLAAFTDKNVASAVWRMVEHDIRSPGVRELTATYGPRLVTKEHCAYLRPVVLQCHSPEPEVARKEYMFPFVAVVECEQEQMLKSIGPTLVATALTESPAWISALTECPWIDRLNLGAIPTNRLDWLQPHEGNIIEFLYRSRALQSTQLG